ncbi:MAG: methyltransferase [Acidobacteriaceae bacterium]|nr:methyltransferase [Acidobacteriaceae bacterium]
MAPETASRATPAQLLGMANGVVIQQCLYAVAKLGLADLLDSRPRTASELAGELKINEQALLRVMRLLTSQGVFEETALGAFAHTDLSQYLRTGVPGSVRSVMIFRGSQFFFAPFGEILYSIQTGQPAREKLFGMNAFDYLKKNPEMARIFDDAMTNMSELMGQAIANAYDFGAWGSVMDVGGGNGILLATILKAHRGLHGVLADLPHVLERARERGFLGGELEARCEMKPCDFLQQIPAGCRAYMMKSVVHDWDDERAHKILVNCRRAVPEDGVLLLLEYALSNANSPSMGRFVDIAMMLLTGGRERTVQEYRELLSDSGFRLNQVIAVPGDFSIIEAFPISN